MENNFLSALDTLFKIHYVFNIKFEAKLTKMFNFLDVFVYKIKNVKPLGVVANIEKKMKFQNLDNKEN